LKNSSAAPNKNNAPAIWPFIRHHGHAMMQRPMIADMAIVVDAVLAISRRCGEGSAKDRPQCSGMVNHEELIMSI
jgi:hypothetical protein